MRRFFESIVIIFRFYLLPRHWKESWVKITNKALWLLGAIWLLISIVEFFYTQASPIPHTPSFFWFVFLATTIVSIVSTLPPLNVVEKVQGVTPIQKHNRQCSKNNQYEIGTIIKLTHRSGFKTYWMAMADVNEHGKPDGKIENLQICLESLWRYIGEKGHMSRLIMPVSGSGRTGINENRITILKEIIFSFVAMTKERKITEELVICIHPSDIRNDKLNIYELMDYLKCQCKYRYEFSNSTTTSKEIS